MYLLVVGSLDRPDRVTGVVKLGRSGRLGCSAAPGAGVETVANLRQVSVLADWAPTSPFNPSLVGHHHAVVCPVASRIPQLAIPHPPWATPQLL